MKWIAISGSWRVTSKKIEQQVRKEVRQIIMSGNGIVSGGALNVDYFATDEAMKHDPSFKKIKIFLPSTLEIYARHYRKRATEKVITSHQAEGLIDQLEKIKTINKDALIEGDFETIDQTAYFDRISKIINHADELIAFQVNGSAGVQDTIDKAQKKGIPVRIFQYKL